MADVCLWCLQKAFITYILFFSEIVLISSRVKYFTSDNITFSYFTSDDFVTKLIKSCLLSCFGRFKMSFLMFISILVFRPEGQI